jgi:hypothetical protein
MLVESFLETRSLALYASWDRGEGLKAILNGVGRTQGELSHQISKQ